MAKRLIPIRGNNLQTAEYVGDLGEVTVNIDTLGLVVHDGVTAGGNAQLLQSDLVNFRTNFHSVDGVKNLKAIPNFVQTARGYHTGSRIGGGQFVFNATRPHSAHDGGTVIAEPALAVYDGTVATLTAFLNWTPGQAGVGCWERLYVGNVIDVLWFGATHDNDSFSSFEAANRFYKELKGIGKFYISRDFVPKQGTKVYGPLTLTTNSAFVTVVTLSYSDLEFHSVTFTQDYLGPVYTLEMLPLITDTTKCDEVKFFNCHLRDSGYFGLLTYHGGDGVVWDGGSIKRVGRDGIDLRGGVGHRLTNGYVEDTGDDALVITNMRHGSVTTPATDFIIDNWVIRRPGYINLGGSGIRIGGKRGIVSNINIYEPNRYGVAISCLDADASVRPDDITCTNVNIFQLNGAVSDSSAYLFRDVDRVSITGGTINCRGDSVDTIGNAFYLRNNSVNPLPDPSNKNITINDVYVVGAENVFHQTVFNTKKIVIKDSTLEACNNPTKFAQNAGYGMGTIIYDNVTVVEPKSNAFIKRNIGEPSITQVKIINCTIESLAPPSYAPVTFGDSSESSKVGRVLIENNRFNLAPSMSFIPVTYAEYDYDLSYRLNAQGTVTIPNGATTSNTAAIGPLGYVPPKHYLNLSPRVPINVAVLEGDLTTTSIRVTTSQNVAANAIVDWSIVPRITAYRNGIS